MNAILRQRPLALIASLCALSLAASCSEPRIVPTPTPTETPAPTPPTAPAASPVDWQDAPITPGNWTWAMIAGQSTSRFAGDLFAMRCNRADGTIRLLRAGSVDGQLPMTIVTETATRPLMARGVPGSTPVIEASLSARDPLLDAMAFSRGRFAVSVNGLATLYIPSWPEVSRVIEDCR
jgi:hypothetical protein